jgi:hypothetical protein
MSKKQVVVVQAAGKGTPAVPSKAKFDAKQWVKNGVTEEEVNTIKHSFDLFDSDQGGSIDISGSILCI